MTFPIAMWHISQKEQFRGFHLKSLTIEQPNPANTVAKGVAQPAIARNSALPAANNFSLLVDSQKNLPDKSPDVVYFTNTPTEMAMASNPTDKTVQAVPVSAAQPKV
ncbi:hypothetical protein QUA32_27880 [Microcoleus sp. Pol14D6]